MCLCGESTLQTITSEIFSTNNLMNKIFKPTTQQMEWCIPCDWRFEFDLLGRRERCTNKVAVVQHIHQELIYIDLLLNLNLNMNWLNQAIDNNQCKHIYSYIHSFSHFIVLSADNALLLFSLNDYVLKHLKTLSLPYTNTHTHAQCKLDSFGWKYQLNN